MSKLLIDERPLQCQPSLAAALGGSDEAIVFQQLHYWLQRATKVQADGHKWVYNSMSDWLKQFPWIKSRSTLSRYFDDLEKRGLVVTGNFNKAKFDKTKWYRIDYDALSDLEQRLYQNESTSDSNSDNGVYKNGTRNDSKSVNGVTQNEATYTNRLPIDYQETTQETTTSKSDADKSSTGEKTFAKIHEYGLNFNKGDHLTKLLKLIDSLGDDLVCWAIQQTVDNANYPNWNFFRNHVIADLQKHNVQSVSEAKELSEKLKQENKQKRQGSYYRKRPPINEPMPECFKQQQEQEKQGKPNQGNWMDQLPDESEASMPDD